MHTKQYTLALMALLPYAMAHGVINYIQGANGVKMAGLSVIDGTPRDCPTPGCGAEDDTTVFRGTNPLGKTVKGGSVDPAKNIAIFMSGASSSAASTSANNNAAAGPAGLLTGGSTDLGDIITGQAGGLDGAAAGAATGAVITGLQGAAGLLGVGKRGLVGGSAGGLVDNVVEGADGVVSSLVGKRGLVGGSAGGLVDNVVEGADGVVSSLVGSKRGLVGGSAGGLVDNVVKGADGVVSSLVGKRGLVGGSAGGLVDNVVEGADGVVSSLVGRKRGVVGGSVGGLVDEVVEGVDGVLSSTVGIGKREGGALQTLENGITGPLTGGSLDAGDILTGQAGGLDGAVAGAATGAVITGLQAAAGAVGVDKRDDAEGTKTPEGTKENMVASSAGKGAQSGLPTADENGVVTLNLHQVNQDGAGPFQASVDSTSGGSSESAFKEAQVLDNVGGLASLSLVTTTDFPVKVQVPQGTVCSATVGGAQNVCIVRLMNNAVAGPFGGSAAFTQTPAQKKRALEFRRIKRSRVARAIEA